MASKENKVMVSYKYALAPTKAQRLILDQWLGNGRFVFNYFLNLNKETYERTQNEDGQGKLIFYNEM
jgi:transposase